MYHYFSIRSWHSQFHQALARGGNISEIHDVCQHLRAVTRLDDAADEAWFRSWTALADRLHILAQTDEQHGHPRTAGHKYDRACIYRLIAERALPPTDPRKRAAYNTALYEFERAITTGDVSVERVDVPYESTSLPALFVPAHGSGDRAPCLIFLNGYDGTKETVYQRVRNEMALRGLSLLLIDQPGTGEALRRRGLTLIPDSERLIDAAYPYLTQRPDIDPERIGVIGISFGSYHACRAAAFSTQPLQCCIAWGGWWTTADRACMANPHYDRAVVPESVPPFHRRWVTGLNDNSAAAAYMRQFSLEAAMPNIRRPFLIMYGAEDKLVSRQAVDRQFQAAANASRRELKIFTTETGGAEHCQNDNSTLALDYAADWAAETLQPAPHHAPTCMVPGYASS